MEEDPKELTHKEVAIKGGLARAEKLTSQERSEIATKAGNALKSQKKQKDPEYYRRIGKLGGHAKAKSTPK